MEDWHLSNLIFDEFIAASVSERSGKINKMASVAIDPDPPRNGMNNQ
jgi:hypothetical protein